MTALALAFTAAITFADTAVPGPSTGFNAQWNELRKAVEKANSDADQQNVKNDEAARSGINAGIRQIEYGRAIIQSYLDLIRAFRELSRRDREFDPAHPGTGAPRLPVSCRSGACRACYRDAQLALNRAVFTLNRLRILYLRTKNFVDKAIAFGNSASGIHAVSGLAWQNEKRGIEASMEGMNQAFDGKKPELMLGLKAALDKLNACEAEHFGNPDWYNRFGFIYYQFMDSRISR